MNAQPETSAKKPYEEIDAAEALRRLREGLALDNCRMAILDLGSDAAVQA